MELKKYQKKVIADLKRYIELLQETHSLDKAYNAFWGERGVMVGGYSGMQPYKSVLPNIPEVCFKVPTGGGKTFLACNAIKTIFDFMWETPTKAVVWLVPSDAILEQTINSLSNPYHPYRQKLDVDFGARVAIYSKEQLLNGQNFNPTSVREQLSIFVLSYDSFRTTKKNQVKHKAYQENGNLSSFAKHTVNSEQLLENVDETALIQIIRCLNPVMIIDESHHAQTTLSKEMKANFNPCFVLELTATPKENSNIISFVDASALKRENMVKIPVIVYNRKSQDDVISDAITVRAKLEAAAVKERANSGKYIRPIVLFQAQPRVGTENTTFEKIKKILIEVGIPSEQIAVKTSEVNDLKKVDLLSEDCPIRYIITVNALKEGWDCPFAYVLATIANKTSSVDVEQILGRVLRLPNTHKNSNQTLNVSYVITSSNDFHATLENVVKGLNQAGFTEQDYRAKEEIITPVVPPAVQISLTDREVSEIEDIPAINVENIMAKVDSAKAEDVSDEALRNDEIFSIAIQENEEYEERLQSVDPTEISMAPSEVRDKMSEYRICEEFRDEIAELRLPQFVQEVGFNLFSENSYELLRPEHLSKGFTLKDKDVVIDFNTKESDVASVDIDDKANATPKIGKLKGFDSAFFKEIISSQPSEKRLSFCKGIIKSQLSKIDLINDKDLEEYIDRIIESMTSEQLSELQLMPYPFVKKIKEKVQDLLAEHCEKTFDLWLEQGIIECAPTYRFPSSISPIDVIKTVSKSLYTAEEETNKYEFDVILELSTLDNIKWWHRNISKRGFCLNGHVNAYPDIIVMTKKGNIILVETKGDHLDGGKSKAKAKIGALWAEKAGKNFRYYMVFQTEAPDYRGACTFGKFIEIIKGL